MELKVMPTHGALNWIGLNPTGIAMEQAPFTPFLDQVAMVALPGVAALSTTMTAQRST